MLKLIRVNDEDGNVSLGCSLDHVWDEVNVTWCIKNHVVVLFKRETLFGNVDGDSMYSFFFVFIKNVGKRERLFAIVLGLFLKLSQSVLRNLPQFVEQVAHQCRLARVNMTDDN